uniref:Uncharacterized protein n=1 Tax=uncultured marine virus TaxID=186617 RepID=A0A0F7L7P6_9VIRU|nr:hypothetical protein [uncultured marine virus]
MSTKTMTVRPSWKTWAARSLTYRHPNGVGSLKQLRIMLADKTVFYLANSIWCN